MTAPDKPMAWMVEAAREYLFPYWNHTPGPAYERHVAELSDIIARRAASAGKGDATRDDRACLDDRNLLDAMVFEYSPGVIRSIASERTRMRHVLSLLLARGWRRAPLAAPTPAPPSTDDEWAAWACWCGAKGSGEKDYRRHKDNTHQSAAPTGTEAGSNVHTAAPEPAPLMKQRMPDGAVLHASPDGAGDRVREAAVAVVHALFPDDGGSEVGDDCFAVAVGKATDILRPFFGARP